MDHIRNTGDEKNFSLNFDDIEQPTTRQLEINGLIEALKTYQLQTGFIITEGEDDTIESNGFTIQVIPAWKFLLTGHQGKL